MLRKAALAVGGLFVVLVLASPLLLKRLLSPERWRAQIIARARKGLHREVKLGGVSLGLLRGLTLDDVSISEAPDFSAGTFVSAKSFSVRVKLLPLLSKRVVVDTVSADALKLRVVKHRDGTYNFSDLTSGSSAAPPPAPDPAATPPAGGRPARPSAPAPEPARAAAPAPQPEASGGGQAVVVDIRNLQLDGASVGYEEEGAPRRVELSGLSARLSGFSMNGTFSAQLAGKARGTWDDRVIDGSASFSGKVDLGGQDPRKLLVDAQALEVSAGGWTARLSGSAKDLTKPALDLAFKVSGPTGTAATGAFKGTVTPPEGAKTLAAEGALSLKTNALAAPEAAALGVLPAGMPLPAVSAAADFSYGGDALTLAKLEAQTPWGPLKAKGRVAGFSKPKVEADLDVETDLKLPAVRGADAPWLKLPAGAALPPLAVAGKARVKGDSVTTPGLTLRGPFGFLELSGSARKSARAGARPDLDLSLSTKLDLPQLSASDLPWAGLPSGLTLPPMQIVGEGRLKGDDLSLSPLRVKGRAGALEAAGQIRGLTSGAPEPELDLTAKLSLPGLKSSDDPFGKVPPGLALPASSWDGSLTASRDEVKIRSLHAVIGRNDFSIDNGRVTGMRSGAPFVNLVVKCRRFQLEDLTTLSQSLKELDLKGGGFFALGATGRLPRPVLEGKAQFTDVGADVSGLKLAGFTGTASFNETRIDIPNLRGKVADGDLDLNLTIKNYAKAPDIEVESSLTRFDLGKYLAAKQALEAKAAPAAGGSAGGGGGVAASAGAAPSQPSQPSQPSPPISTRGKFTVGELVHPNGQARDIRLDWDLAGITPDMRRLNGSAKVASPSGHFSDLESLGKQSKVLKYLTLPLRPLKGVFLLVFHIDLNNPAYSDFAGDYAFTDGVMNIRDSHAVVTDHDVELKGSVDLPKETLDLTATVHLGAQPIDVAVTGTLEDPKTKIKVAKLLAEPLKQGAEQLLKSILHK